MLKSLQKISSVYNQNQRKTLVEAIRYSARQKNNKSYQKESKTNTSYLESYIHIDKSFQFTNQEYIIYDHLEDESQRRLFIPVIILLLAISAFSLKRAYNYKDRYKISIPFYLLLGGYLLVKVKLGIGQYNVCISRIGLQPDGKTVNFHLRKYLFKRYIEQIDIKTIQRPEEDSVNPYTSPHLAFHLTVKDNTYLLPRAGKIIDNQCLPAILNANYITYANQLHTPHII